MEEKIKEIVIACVKETLEDMDSDATVNEELALFGEKSPLDSITLVSLIVDIESELSNYDIDVSLNSENAMSTKNSPFLNIKTLVNFIQSEAQ